MTARTRSGCSKAKSAKGVLCLLASLLLGAPAAAGPSIEIEWSSEPAPAGGAKGAVQLETGEILATRTQWADDEVTVICSKSADGGQTWRDLAIIAREQAPADLGDGHLIQLPDGDILYSYRHNKYGESNDTPRDYSIRVMRGAANGKTWTPHSTVAVSRFIPGEDPGAKRGLWSSFLLHRSDGTLQCYYDDEDTPHRNGFRRHQWLTMKTWEPETRRWIEPVTVSRAHNPNHLSRDGMPTVVELPSGRLLCAYESVQVSPPHANCVRKVISDDGGRSWTWNESARETLFAPKNDHLAVSPWMVPLGDEKLICVFATDEDRAEPSVAGAPAHEFRMDIKYVVSLDAGKTWSSRSRTVFDETHRSYIPGILSLGDRSLLVTFFDFSRRGAQAITGELHRESK